MGLLMSLYSEVTNENLPTHSQTLLRQRRKREVNFALINQNILAIYMGEPEIPFGKPNGSFGKPQ